MLLESALRDEWGFQGWVLSDWNSTQSTVASAKASAEQAAWDEASYYVAHKLDGLPQGLVPPVGSLPPGTTRFLWPAPGAVIAQGFGPSPYLPPRSFYVAATVP